MYEQHWRLNRPAFRSNSDAEFFFSGRTHEAAVLKLQYLVSQRQGIAVLTGAAGTGKTCVLQQFSHQLPPNAGPVVSVFYPQMTSSELISYLTSKLEAYDGSTTTPPAEAGLDRVLTRLENRLISLTQSGRHPVLVIDDAHLMTDKHIFQALQLLLNFQQSDTAEFSIVLAGQSELVGQVKRHGGLLDRLAFISALAPLQPEETAAYIRHRLDVAGGSADIFDARAMSAIHEHSAGYPRRINRLCDFALLVGYAENLDQISDGQIEAVADEMTLAA